MTETPWMNRNEAAAYLGVSLSTLNRLVVEQKLTRHRAGGKGHPRYLRADLDALMKPADA